MTQPTAGGRRDFRPEAIGHWSGSHPSVVTRERIVQYAEATNDPIAAHRAGDLAPPVFPVVLSFASMMQAIMAVASPDVGLRAVHGGQDFRLHRPIRPGDLISARAQPVGYRGGASGTAVTLRLECRDREGALVNEQYTTAFYRGADAGESVGSVPSPLTFDDALRDLEPVARTSQHIDDDQTFRYAAASGDSTPIHVDDDFARRVGLPGIIVHGLCTQAMVSAAILDAVAEGDSTRLERYAVRFARSVRPGQDITTTIWRTRAAAGVTRYAFETVAGDTVVLKNGIADVADAA